MGVSIYGRVLENENLNISDENIIETNVHRDFKRSLLDSEVLGYDFEDDFGEISGPSISYSTYNYFRNELSIAALGMDMGEVWGVVRSLGEEEDYPEAIYHVINFSDCEGVMGPKAVKELSEYLTNNYTRMKKYFVDLDEDFYLSIFEEFYKCINETASESGYLIYS